MISIVFPTLNEEAYIGESIRALKTRMTIPYEIIVSDGRSKDRTVEIAKAMANKVVVYSGLDKQNISKGRNDGAKVASGEFIVFMDADSRIPEPDKFFSKALSNFENIPNLVAMTTRLKVYPETETLSDKIIFGWLTMNLAIMNNILHKGESTGEFQMIRKNIFDSLGGFREDLITREDADMFMRLSKVGRTMLDRDLTVYHSGRRAHKIGWPKLLKTWILNSIWVVLFDKAKEKEWTEVR